MEADALVDAYAQVPERALITYQGRIKPDEVGSPLLSAYIQPSAVEHVRVGKKEEAERAQRCAPPLEVYVMPLSRRALPDA
jgi:hypothetical protein